MSLVHRKVLGCIQCLHVCCLAPYTYKDACVYVCMCIIFIYVYVDML